MLPKDLPLEGFPYLVFADKTYGWIESLIKIRTEGQYNHVMFAIAPDKFASQGGTYATFGFSAYMKKGNRLKFVEIVGLTDIQKGKIFESIGNKLNKPWYKKRYDFLGILGQAVGIKKVNNPWTDYCSEDVVEHIKNMAKIIPYEDKRKKVFVLMPDHGSPQDLNDYIKQNPEQFKTVARWDYDENS